MGQRLTLRIYLLAVGQAVAVALLLLLGRTFLGSHPIAQIAALDLAAEGDATAAREALADITEDWVDLERLVEDVLAAARFDLAHGGGSAPLRIAPTQLQPIFDKAVARFRTVHPSRHLVADISP